MPGAQLARQPYYRWLANPITAAELVRAYRSNALFDAHKGRPELGHRRLVDEARAAGEMADRTAWRIALANGWWSAFGKGRRDKGRRVGSPVHYGMVGCDFTADAPDRLWLTDITEHRTKEGKLYLCAVKDGFSGRIVGCPIDSRRKSRLAVDAIENAVARRDDIIGCIIHSGRGRPSQKKLHTLAVTTWSDRWVGRRRGRQLDHGIVLQSALEERPEPALMGTWEELRNWIVT